VGGVGDDGGDERDAVLANDAADFGQGLDNVCIAISIALLVFGDCVGYVADLRQLLDEGHVTISGAKNFLQVRLSTTLFKTS